MFQHVPLSPLLLELWRHSVWSRYIPTGLWGSIIFSRDAFPQCWFGWCLLFCLLVRWVFPLSSPFCCGASQLNFLFQLLSLLVLNFPLKYILFLSWGFLCWDFRFISFRFFHLFPSYLIVCWNMFIIVTLASLSDSSNVCQLTVDIYWFFFFPHSLRSFGSWYDEWFSCEACGLLWWRRVLPCHCLIEVEVWEFPGKKVFAVAGEEGAQFQLWCLAAAEQSFSKCFLSGQDASFLDPLATENRCLLFSWGVGLLRVLGFSLVHIQV